MTIDFYIQKSRFGLYTSIATDGRRLTTALTEEACREITKNIRIPVLEGAFDGYCSGNYDGTVHGKL